MCNGRWIFMFSSKRGFLERFLDLVERLRSAQDHPR